jgi:hypothetical protein
MVLTVEDIDAHAALLRLGTGNTFWRAMCQFVNTFSENDSERRAWFEFLAAWREELEESDAQTIGD